MMEGVLYGERDVSVDVHFGLEGGVGGRWGGMLPDYGGVYQLEWSEGCPQVQAESGRLVVAMDVVQT